MLLLRIVGMLAALAIGSGVVAWLVTRDVRYLKVSWRIAQGALLFLLAVLGLMALERVIAL